jgi:uncharacterized membrane protein YraQ (UPF0718 family)
MIVFICLLFLFDFDKGLSAIDTINYSMKEMIFVIPPIFILLGLMDVWVPREIMVKHMGEEAGIKGVILAFLIGSFAAGPLYGAFPIASVFMKKGVKFTNVLIFIGAWSTTKIPMFLFEAAALGQKFAVTRLLLDIPGIIIIAWLINTMISKKEILEIYKKAEQS